MGRKFFKLSVSRVTIPVTLVFLAASFSLASGQHGAAQLTTKNGHHWQAPDTEKKRKNPVASTSASIERGRYHYMENCAECHGRKGMGEGPLAAKLATLPPNLKEMTAHHTAGDFFWKIKVGKGDMPGWQDVLGANEIWDTVNYLKSLTEDDGQIKK